MVSSRGEKGMGHSQIGRQILDKTFVIIFDLFQFISILQLQKKDQYQFHVELKLPFYCNFLSQLFVI